MMAASLGIARYSLRARDSMNTLCFLQPTQFSLTAFVTLVNSHRIILQLRRKGKTDAGTTEVFSPNFHLNLAANCTAFGSLTAMPQGRADAETAEVINPDFHMDLMTTCTP